MKTKKERTGYKVELRTLINDTVAICQWIESWSNTEGAEIKKPDTEHYRFNRPANAHQRGEKTKQFKRVAKHVKSYLYDSKRKNDSNKVALTTYHSYLGKIRKAIMRGTNYKHHDLGKNIKKLISDYPSYEGEITPILSCSAENLVDTRANILKALLKDKSVLSEELYNKITRIPTSHTLIALLVKSDRQVAERKDGIKSKLIKRKSNAISLNYAHLEYTIEALLASEKFDDLTIGVALSTGRRAIEVIHVGKFESTNSKHQIKFSGQAKRAPSAQDKPYFVPVLIDADKIINAVNKLRKTEEYKHAVEDLSELPKNEQNIVINRRLARSLNARIKDLFDNESITFKDTRATAINIALSKIFTQKKYKKIDKNVFVQQYAGHGEFDEFKNYQHVKIDFKASKPETESKDTKDTGVNLSALEAITDDLKRIDEKGIKSVVKLHDKVLSVLANKGFALSVSSIYKGKKIEGAIVKIGGSRPVITRYMDLAVVKKAVEQYHTDNNLKTRG